MKPPFKVTVLEPILQTNPPSWTTSAMVVYVSKMIVYTAYCLAKLVFGRGISNKDLCV